MLQPMTILVGIATLVVAFAVAASFVPGVTNEGMVSLLVAAVLYKALQLGIMYVWPSISSSGVYESIQSFRMIESTLLLAALFWLVGQIVPGYKVRGVAAAILGSIVISVVQIVVAFFSMAAFIST